MAKDLGKQGCLHPFWLYLELQFATACSRNWALGKLILHSRPGSPDRAEKSLKRKLPVFAACLCIDFTFWASQLLNSPEHFSAIDFTCGSLLWFSPLELHWGSDSISVNSLSLIHLWKFTAKACLHEPALQKNLLLKLECTCICLWKFTAWAFAFGTSLQLLVSVKWTADEFTCETTLQLTLLLKVHF